MSGAQSRLKRQTGGRNDPTLMPTYRKKIATHGNKSEARAFLMSMMFAAVLSTVMAFAPLTDPWLIVAGQCVGKIRLGQEFGPLQRLLGPRSQSPGHDGYTAMGRDWSVWVGKSGHELDVYSERGTQDSAAHPQQEVRQVRVTSPSFHTASGLHVGLAVGSLAGAEKLVVKDATLFDDKRHGITLEGRAGLCTAILIHPKGEGALSRYLPFPGYQG